jgi:TonB family protein
MFLRMVIGLYLFSSFGYGFAQTKSLPSGDLPRVHLSETASARHLLKKVDPVYPQDAKRAGIEGDVVIRILVGIDGHVAVLDTLSGNAMLRKAARRAVMQWQYDTYDPNGQISEVVTLARVRFRLPTDGTAPQ